jgi:hypothetical protein
MYEEYAKAFHKIEKFRFKAPAKLVSTRFPAPLFTQYKVGFAHLLFEFTHPLVIICN